MQTASFLCGALAGAGILAALALHDAARTRERERAEGRGFTPSEAEAMNEEAVQASLNAFFFKINALAMKCSSLSAESGARLALGHVWLEGESLLHQAEGRMEDFMARTGRACAVSQLKDLGRQMEELFAHWRPVFVRANRILAARGVRGVPLKGFTLQDVSPDIDCSLANEDWILDFSGLAERIAGFAGRLGDASDRLASLLEQEADSPAASPASACSLPWPDRS